MPWNPLMPTDFTDGQIVDELDLDPIVQNITWLRYATVFMGGVRRTSNVTTITTTEVAVMQTPSITQNNGYQYRIEGMCKTGGSNAANTVELRLHQGAGLLGAVVQSFATPELAIASAGYGIYFSFNDKILADTTQVYTLGIRRIAGTGNITCYSTSWMSVLRAGDNTLITDV